MDTNSSDMAATFNFGNKDAAEVKQNENKESTASDVPVKTSYEEDEELMNSEYVDKRSVTIALVKNHSYFREANRAALPTKVDYIGSCITSSRMLCSNKDEMNAYFPEIIGVSPSDPEFLRRVKIYLGNIQIKVDALGKTFNTSFRYRRYRDYLKIAKKEEEIENRYKASPRRTEKELKDALKRKLEDLNILEQSKHHYGQPINVEEYLMYRHCLFYGDIAKDQALVNYNTNRNIRFYFKDDKQEADKARKLRTEINKAKANFVACLADERLFEAMYVQYLVQNNLPVISSLLEDEVIKQNNLDRYSQSYPDKFNKFFKDENIKLKSTIEVLVSRGILIRSEYNQNITTADGTLLGANMLETVAWFKNPVNTAQVEAYYNQLRNI